MTLLTRVRDALGAGWQVVVLTDRGLESPALFRAIVGLGMHPLMRIKGGGTFRPAGWTQFDPVGWFAARDGDWFGMAGTAYATTRLPCILLASRTAGHAEAWVLLTDLPPAAAAPCWYAYRSWIEQGFKVVKSGGWDGQKTRMADPGRATRMWVAVAVATAWLVEVGGWPSSSPGRKRSRGSGRRPGGAGTSGVPGGAGADPGRAAGRRDGDRAVPEPWPDPQPYPARTEVEFRDRKT